MRAPSRCAAASRSIVSMPATVSEISPIVVTPLLVNRRWMPVSIAASTVSGVSRGSGSELSISFTTPVGSPSAPRSTIGLPVMLCSGAA
jgi:hypothetical protein